MIEVHTLQAAKDNYIFILKDSKSDAVAVIDPTEAAPVDYFLKQKKWNLNLILNTHHHWDHIGGNDVLKSKFDCQVWCSTYDINRIQSADRGLKEGDVFQIGNELVEVWENPGHTIGAISFYLPKSQMIFPGDTLFTLGCGRLFEGSPEQMFKSLQRFRTLPPLVKVYSGHEYGWSNAQFTRSLMPENREFDGYLRNLQDHLRKGGFSVPSTIGLEIQWNPFLNASDSTEFAKIRALKDNFRLEAAL